LSTRCSSADGDQEGYGQAEGGMSADGDPYRGAPARPATRQAEAEEPVEGRYE